VSRGKGTWGEDQLTHEQTTTSTEGGPISLSRNSGLKVSAISYGNWVTHGSQVEADQATACVRAALEAGITTF
jgi:hypothetical protein